MTQEEKEILNKERLDCIGLFCLGMVIALLWLPILPLISVALFFLGIICCGMELLETFMCPLKTIRESKYGKMHKNCLPETS